MNALVLGSRKLTIAVPSGNLRKLPPSFSSNFRSPRLINSIITPQLPQHSVKSHRPILSWSRAQCTSVDKPEAPLCWRALYFPICAADWLWLYCLRRGGALIPGPHTLHTPRTPTGCNRAEKCYLQREISHVCDKYLIGEWIFKFVSCGH